MHGVLRLASVTAAAILWVGTACAAATAPPPAALTPLAHSAQLEVDGAATPQGLSLRIVPVRPGTALTVTGVTVSFGDGHSVAATAAADGSWQVPLAPDAAGGKLQILVAHDGIREVLDAAQPTRAAPAAPRRAWADHKQLAWWILNIAIVLIAAFAISRRMA